MASPLIASVVVDGKQVEIASLYSVFACGVLVLAADPDGTAARPSLIRSVVSTSDLPGYQDLRAPV
jgi:hypothetical protein